VIGLDALTFRRVLSHLPTGVTIVTGHTVDGPTGMAANSVTSVSLDPPVILFCPARSSATWPGIRESGAFCVNIMASHHEPLIRRFAMKGVDRFDGVKWSERAAGPALQGAVAWIECRIETELVAGDHTVVLGGVIALEASTEVEPLVLFRGSYGSFRGIEDAR
jgi:3-hydroxy-9,10-secoandrosta-1,3,5(10)-triene-9,17-dione monooxygenase reductase component